MNYQKELDKIDRNSWKKKKMCRHFCFTVAVHPAAVMYWNI